MIEFRVNSCCGCASLRRGTMILAILATVFSVLSLVIVIVQCTTGNYYVESQNTPEFQKLYPKIAIPYVIIYLIINACFLVGVIQSKREYMLPYIVLNGSLLVTYAFLILILTIAFPIILVGLISITVGGYYWLVIYSYYLSLAPLPQQVMFKPEV